MSWEVTAFLARSLYVESLARKQVLSPRGAPCPNRAIRTTSSFFACVVMSVIALMTFARVADSECRFSSA